jgi:putative membrane protein
VGQSLSYRFRGKLVRGPVLSAAHHHACARLLRKLIDNRDQHSHRWFRFFNEVPVLLLVAIVVLVVVKPF